jgi:RNA recognition motif-containing protein
MESKIYVGNLSYTVNKDDLKKYFEDNGIATKDVTVITDRETGRSKGFGFVTVENDSIVEDAINKLNGIEYSGRKLTISKAQPKKEKRSFGGGQRY